MSSPTASCVIFLLINAIHAYIYINLKLLELILPYFFINWPVSMCKAALIMRPERCQFLLTFVYVVLSRLTFTMYTTLAIHEKEQQMQGLIYSEFIYLCVWPTRKHHFSLCITFFLLAYCRINCSSCNYVIVLQL